MPEQLSFIADLPNRYTDIPPASAQANIDLAIRKRTACLMQCRNCGRDLWITPAGNFLCSDMSQTCTRLISLCDIKSINWMLTIDDFRQAWPDRVIERRKN